MQVSDIVEVFVTTNGRSTFEYCKMSLDWQRNINFKLTIISDVKWIDANNRMVDECNCPFFIRVDDDMFLHPLAISFMEKSICRHNQSSQNAMTCFHLWEPWSNKSINGIKIYTHAICKKIRFRPSRIGKIDKTFKSDLDIFGYKTARDHSVVGVHSCSTFEENLHYAIMRGEDKNKNYPKKKEWMRRQINNFNMSLSDQLLLSDEFLYKFNTKIKSKFYKFILKYKTDL